MKAKLRNKALIILLLGATMGLQSCVYVVNTPGPPGRAGSAWFGVNYEHVAPMSYWDNNPSVPHNPLLGEYYPTAPGVYDFEYFINPIEYWFGTYEIWINPGGPGGPYGEPGFDGLDTYMMLICDPHGFHDHRANFKTAPVDANEPLVIERRDGKFQYRITIRKATTTSRPTQNTPKFQRP